MQTVTETIGKEYSDWKLEENDNDDGRASFVFISAPTGSGKTHFILNTWLPYMAKNKKSILYLVNRSILKKQIQDKIKDRYPEISSYIDVKLYQEIENEIKINEYKNGKSNDYPYYNMDKYLKYSCVVCDECHYFLSDSNYNTDNALSFRWIYDCFFRKIKIFMSATIDDIKLYIKAYNKFREFQGEQHKYNYIDSDMISKINCTDKNESIMDEFKGFNRFNYYEYDIQRKYDYLDITIINEDDIVDFILESDKTEKWLVFVDNIKFGNSLKEKFKDEAVAFLTSKNKNDEEESKVIYEMTTAEKTNKRIIIATSVMDNGINIKDIELRNVVIMADTEIEFIQMLGRKRKDDKILKLYICKYDKKHFEERLRNIKETIDMANDYMSCIIENKNMYVNVYNENIDIEKLHIKYMRKLAENSKALKYAQSIFNVYAGVMYLNLLSYQNFKQLKEYYQSIINEFNINGNDAYAKIQLGWLGVEGEKADEIINNSAIDIKEKYMKKVVEAFESINGQNMTSEEWRRFKISIKSELLKLLESLEKNDKWKTVYDTIQKNDRKISKNNMEYLKEHLKLPYCLKIENEVYTVMRVE